VEILLTERVDASPGPFTISADGRAWTLPVDAPADEVERLSAGQAAPAPALVTIGKLDDIKQKIKENRGFYYFAEGRLYMTEYPKDALDKARKIYKGAVLAGMEEGVNALYQKCVHLGCRVPECKASQWFECPCHGSKYNRVGEKKAGPAPRGLDRFGVTITGGVVSVDTSPAGLSLGPPIGTNTTGQEAEGPHCA